MPKQLSRRDPRQAPGRIARGSVCRRVCLGGWAAALLSLAVLWTATSPAQTGAPPAGPPRAWVEAAAANQQHILDQEDHLPVRYRVHKIDNRGDVVRLVVETQQGNVARLIGREGQPLLAAEDAAERSRLQEILNAPSDFLRREERDRASRHYAEELMRAMPGAMLWSYTPGQPQRPGTHPAEIVLDYRPDPAFHPPTLVTEALTGIAGRLWIDPQTQCLTRVEGRILHTVNFGWGGMLARIAEGGTLAFEQQQIATGRWLYSRLSEHITLREVMIHTVHENAEITVSDVERLPALPSYGDAIRALLALPVPTR